MAYQHFPTLSARAAFRHLKGKYERPADTVEFDAGDDMVFVTTSTGRYKELPVEIKMPQEDFDVFTQFLESVNLAGEPFIYDHPIVGTSVVRFGATEYEWEVLASPPQAWYAVRFTLKGRFRD